MGDEEMMQNRGSANPVVRETNGDGKDFRAYGKKPMFDAN